MDKLSRDAPTHGLDAGQKHAFVVLPCFTAFVNSLFYGKLFI